MPIAINGSGTITGISAGGLPDASVTAAELASGAVTQVKLASGVAGTGPAFMASASGATSMNSDVLTKIAFASEQYDTASCYDTSLSRFTPNVAGFYMISTSVGGPFNSGDYFAVNIYKNGSIAIHGNISSAAGGYVANTNGVIYMNGTTDYIEIYAAQSIGSTASTYTNASNPGTMVFSGFLARSA